jgi:putative peptidoglycan lipid II flippase
MNIAFVPIFKHAGLALSIGLGACVNAGLLYFFMRKQGIFVPQPEWLAFLLKIVVALYAMGGVLLWVSGADSLWLGAGTFTKCLRLTWVVFAGAFTYFASLWVMGFRLSQFSRRAG